MNRESLIRYGQLKAEIKKLETELDMLQPQVLKDIITELPKPGDEYISLPELEGVGKYTWYPKKSWTYSDFTQASEKALKERKAEEQKTGEATYTEEPVLKFIQPKE